MCIIVVMCRIAALGYIIYTCVCVHGKNQCTPHQHKLVYESNSDYVIA